jgi:hypothetical protein
MFSFINGNFTGETYSHRQPLKDGQQRLALGLSYTSRAVGEPAGGLYMHGR